jgi:Na+/glutamate symporter
VTQVTVYSLFAYTFGIVVYFFDVHLDRKLQSLRAYYLPEPVSGGLAVRYALT